MTESGTRTRFLESKASTLCMTPVVPRQQYTNHMINGLWISRPLPPSPISVKGLMIRADEVLQEIVRADSGLAVELVQELPY